MAWPSDLSTVTLTEDSLFAITDGRLLSGVVEFTPQTIIVKSDGSKVGFADTLAFPVETGVFEAEIPITADPQYSPATAYKVQLKLTGVTNPPPFTIEIPANLAGQTIALYSLSQIPTFTIPGQFIPVAGTNNTPITGAINWVFTSAGQAASFGITGDVTPRLAVNADGTLSWLGDTSLTRSAAGELTLVDNLKIKGGRVKPNKAISLLNSGITTSGDQTAAIQALFDAQSNTAATFYIDDLFPIADELFYYSNHSYIGLNNRTCGFTQTSTDKSVWNRTTAANHVTFKHLRMQGPGAGSSTAKAAILGSNSVASGYLEWEDNDIRGFGEGVYFGRWFVSKIEHNVHQSLNGTAFRVDYGTSTSLLDNYALNCAGAGYHLNNLTYVGGHGNAVDKCDQGYYIDTCRGGSLVSCGAESLNVDGGVFPGDAFTTTGSDCRVSLINCLSYHNVYRAVWVTGGSKTQILGFVEETPDTTNPPINSIVVDTSSAATVIDSTVTTAASYSGSANRFEVGTTSRFQASGNASVARYTSTTGSGTNTQPVLASFGIDTSVRAYGMALSTDAGYRKRWLISGQEDSGDGGGTYDVSVGRQSAGVWGMSTGTAISAPEFIANGVVLSPPLFARKTADVSITSSTSLTNDADLTVVLATSSTYTFECFLIYDAATTGDLSVGWVIPTGSTINWTPFGGPTSLTSSVTQLKVNDIGNTSDTLGGAGSGTKLVARLRGIIRTSTTAGSLTLRWAQAVSDATATKVYTDSFLSAQKVA